MLTGQSRVELAERIRSPAALPILNECLQRAVGKRIRSNFPEVADLRLRLFEKANDAAGCRATAEMWEKQGRTDLDSLYKAACCRAVTAALLRKPTTPGADATQIGNEQSDRAMDWLRQAVAAGYKDVATLKKDKDLDVLRERADFKKLLADVLTRTGKEIDEPFR